MIHGKKIYLRALVKADIDILYDMCIDKDVLKFNGGQAAIPSKRYVREKFIALNSVNKKVLAIVNNESDVVGYIHYKENSYTIGVFSIGITIGKEYWGKRYGREAIKLIGNYLFSKKRAHKIELEVVKENQRAITCYKECGFKTEGIRRSKYYLDGKYLDTVVMGVLKSEFKFK